MPHVPTIITSGSCDCTIHLSVSQISTREASTVLSSAPTSASASTSTTTPLLLSWLWWPLKSRLCRSRPLITLSRGCHRSRTYRRLLNHLLHSRPLLAARFTDLLHRKLSRP